MNRITIDDVHAEIVSAQYHLFPGTTTTVCCLTLRNGFTVLGKSACVDPTSFNELVGRDIARAEAVDEVWKFLGFRLCDQLASGREHAA